MKRTALIQRHETLSLWKRGDHMVWLTGGSLAVCLFMIFMVVGVIVWNGAGFFWPKPVMLYEMKSGEKHLAIFREKETIALAQAREQHLEENPVRRMVMVANRDLYGQDFIWLNDQDIASISMPPDAWVLERVEYGPFIGFIRSIKIEDRELVGAHAVESLSGAIDEAAKIAKAMYQLERYEIGRVNARIERNRIEKLKVERRLSGAEQAGRLEALAREIEPLQQHYRDLVAQVAKLRVSGAKYQIELMDVKGATKRMSLLGVLDAWQPNRMTFGDKARHYVQSVWEFLASDPREANTEGGVFPAIFGTAMMVMLMTLAVVPFGVLTAFYLSEYAKQGLFVRTVRIALNNLAGVPSIVYGVFGLGFFVYFCGGSIDQIFYPEKLPNPTWGTGGILWASLTLALLTVPVVVMATEESISAVPRGMREGSLALGASKFQTLKNILLPASLPGILTGVILAMARGAGEVAPLMITGVVKLAPSLPVDGIAPYVHLERKFMHLGFHIYDVGFQSPNVEASRPMVFTTALLLILLVLALNLGAILIRDRVRKKYRTGAFN